MKRCIKSTPGSQIYQCRAKILKVFERGGTSDKEERILHNLKLLKRKPVFTKKMLMRSEMFVCFFDNAHS